MCCYLVVVGARGVSNLPTPRSFDFSFSFQRRNNEGEIKKGRSFPPLYSFFSFSFLPPLEWESEEQIVTNLDWYREYRFSWTIDVKPRDNCQTMLAIKR